MGGPRRDGWIAAAIACGCGYSGEVPPPDATSLVRCPGCGAGVLLGAPPAAAGAGVPAVGVAMTALGLAAAGTAACLGVERAGPALGCGVLSSVAGAVLLWRARRGRTGPPVRLTDDDAPMGDRLHALAALPAPSAVRALVTLALLERERGGAWPEGADPALAAAEEWLARPSDDAAATARLAGARAPGHVAGAAASACDRPAMLAGKALLDAVVALPDDGVRAEALRRIAAALGPSA